MATEEIDYYALLEVGPESTLGQIRTAYRQRSLKVHPDRNPDNPDAAALFHNLVQAFEILSDPQKRSAFDALNAARLARKTRFQGLDNKRKALAEDLQRREEEFKRSKGEEDVLRRQERSELERLREDGKRRREEADRTAQGGIDQDMAERRQRVQEQKRQAEQERTGSVELGPLDTTLKIKWLRSLHPKLISSTAVMAFLFSRSNTKLMATEIDSLIISPKFLANPLKGKHGSAVISLHTLTAAVQLMKAGAVTGMAKVEWEGLEITWASGAPPAVLAKDTPPPVIKPSSFPSSMLVDSDESRILEMMRQKERAKMIAELELADASGA